MRVQPINGATEHTETTSWCAKPSGMRRAGREAVRNLRSLSVISVISVAAVVSSGCRQDMHDQPRYKPLAKSDFFADGRSERPLVPGTVARGWLREDARLYTGKEGAAFVTEFPLPVDLALVQRGRQRFEIFCTPCHGRTGAANGMVVQRGYRKPPSYHIDRLRHAPPGYIFDVITSGFGAMPDYASQIPVRDRWAIVAYVRALQLSQYAGVDDVPADKRAELDRPAAAGADGQGHAGGGAHSRP